MAKRFTDTGKWKMAWFRELSPKLKAINDFICDNCDHAGIWDIDLKGLSFYVNEMNSRGVVQDISLGEIDKAFQGKVVFIGNDKLFLEVFVLFQYKLKSLTDLKFSNTVHKSIVDRLEKYQIISVQSFKQENSDVIKTNIIILKGLPMPLVEGAVDKDKDIYWDKDMDKDMDKDRAHKSKFKFDFESIYQKFPRKVGKTKGLEICRKTILSSIEFDNLFHAVDRYKAHVTNERTEAKYIMHFSTFMSRWTDWSDSDAGTSSVSTADRADLSGIFDETGA